MIDELMLRLLKRDENIKLYPYKDSLGYWTIGIGHLIDRRMGGSLPSWIQPSFPITEQEAFELCRFDITNVLKELSQKLPQFPELSEVRQAVLASMAFQMGVGGLLKFKDMITAITKHDWNLAAEEMLDSKWFREQTPERSTRLGRAMRTNDMAAFELV